MHMEKVEKLVGRGALSAPVRKLINELSEISCCYLESEALWILRYHEKSQGKILKTEQVFEIWKSIELEILPDLTH